MNPISAFAAAPTPVKIGVGIALLGIALYALYKARKGATTASQVDASGTLASSNGAVNVAQMLAALGYDTSTRKSETAGGNVNTPPASAPAATAQLPSAGSNAPKPTPTSTARYVNVVPWYPGSSGDSTLGNIASNEHVSGGLAGLLRLNPTISNPDVVQPGQKIRVA